MPVKIRIAEPKDEKFASYICDLIEDAAKVRGTGIAKREPEYIREKINQGKAVIALDGEEVAGFCYIETWSDAKFVVNSGLIVNKNYRKTGLARKIKAAILDLSVKKYPNAQVFGITTSLAVMKINSDLGYKPVTFSELTDDDRFWNGCKSCVNYDILTRTDRKLCLCTGMIYEQEKKAIDKIEPKKRKNQWEQFQNFLKMRSKRMSKWLKNDKSKS